MTNEFQSTAVILLVSSIFFQPLVTAQTSLELETNSAITNPQLRLVETETGFARISWENTNNPGKYWTIAGLTNDVGSSRLNFYYENGASGSDILTIHGDNKTVGVGTNAPNYALDIQQTLPSPGTGTGPWGGINLNAGAGNNWTMGAFSNLFDFYYNNVLKGRISGVDGSYTPMSDIRLKEEIETIETPQLANILKLRPVSYHMKDDFLRSSKATGFIAQAVQEIYPNLVISGAESDSYLSLNYTAMIPYLVKGIQELAEQNEHLYAEITLLKQQVKSSSRSSKRSKKK